jgi:hypothetical protein
VTAVTWMWDRHCNGNFEVSVFWVSKAMSFVNKEDIKMEILHLRSSSFLQSKQTSDQESKKVKLGGAGVIQRATRSVKK